MKTLFHQGEQNLTERATTVIETMVAVALVALIAVSLYAGLTSGFAVTKLFRENSRATQIMVQQLETVRLYRWSQLLSAKPAPVYIPSAFIEYYDPGGKAANSAGTLYTVKITQSVPTNLPAAYRNNMRVFTVDLTWTSGNLTRRRQMQTLVARSGMQNYVFK